LGEAEDDAARRRAHQGGPEYDSLEFRDGETVEEFALRLQGMLSQLAVLGDAILEKEAVKKYLHIVPEKYEQVAASIETMLDLANISIEEVTGRLTAAEDRFARRAVARSGRVTASCSTHAEWTTRTNPQCGEVSSAQGGGSGAKVRGKAPKKKGSKPPLGKDQCRRCGKTGH
jgi:23S rRNA maturation mini-RNase III